MDRGIPRMNSVPEPSDAVLIAASRSDPERFGLIFERHHAAILSYLRRRVGPQEAADLAAETFVTAFRTRARYEVEHEGARPWLFGIATNLLRHHWRRERRRLRAYARTGRDPVESGIEEAEDRADAERAWPRLARALASLPRAEREVLLLHVWADLSQTEIAQALEIPVGTVYSRLSRARARIREGLLPSGKERGEAPIPKETRHGRV